MNRNYVFRDVNQALPRLMDALLQYGSDVGSRAGKTKELTHVGITLLMPQDRYVLVPGRKVNLAAQIVETVWVLAGRNDIEVLSEYLPRAKDFSDDGDTWRAGYGQRIRRFGYPRSFPGVDQLQYVVDLLRKDPMSRQAVISIWDPEVDTTPGKDLPCNDWLCFTNRLGYLDLQVALRSNDVMWGWSNINQFEWSTLLEIVAFLVGVRPGKLHFSTASFHLYERHFEKARRIAEEDSNPIQKFTRGNPSFQWPGLHKVGDLDTFLVSWLQIERMIRTKGPDHLEVRSAVEQYAEPMLRSWLRVIQWWWSGGDYSYLDEIEGTPVYAAAQLALQPSTKAGGIPETYPLPRDTSPFLQATIKLHNMKSAAYGNSWKRRGEFLAILANIARKVDRLGGGDTSDETSADTAMDLFVYLAKYRAWLLEHRVGEFPPGLQGFCIEGTPVQDLVDLSTEPEVANVLMWHTERVCTFKGGVTNGILETRLKKTFDALEKEATNQLPERGETVEDMMSVAYQLARRLWEAEEGEYRGADAD